MSRLRRLLGQKGQTAVEYLLLIVVAFGIGMTFKKKIEEFMFKNPNSFLTQRLNALNSSFQDDPTGRYSTFKLQKFR